MSIRHSTRQREAITGQRTAATSFLSNGTENSYDDLIGTIHSTASFSSIHSHGEGRSPLGDITLNINRVE